MTETRSGFHRGFRNHALPEGLNPSTALYTRPCPSLLTPSGERGWLPHPPQGFLWLLFHGITVRGQGKSRWCLGKWPGSPAGLQRGRAQGPHSPDTEGLVGALWRCRPTRGHLEAAPLPRAHQVKQGFSTCSECVDPLSVGSGLPGAPWGCLSPTPGQVCPS